MIAGSVSAEPRFVSLHTLGALRVVIVANPRSGSGKGVRLADQAAAFLTKAGIAVARIDVGPGLPPLDPHGVMANATAVVAAGGDGTVLWLAEACAEARVPIYHLPAGNENLFAREFGMSADPAGLLTALRKGRIARFDMGWCDTQGRRLPFLLMASIGPDASVVHRLHATRRSAIGHWAYASPILREFVEPSLPRIQAWCDGRLVVDGKGMLVVGNCRHYGFGVNPCADASVTDGLLDLTFIPADTAVDTLAGMTRLRLNAGGADLIRSRAAMIQVCSTGPAPLQLDGEAVLDPEQPVGAQFSTSREALQVLTVR